jgi:glyoxylase-like metal-dependent hydrolase (beta-lactamase superfamily II)
MLKVHVFTFNDFMENTIIVWDDESKEAAVIDPGNSNVEEDKKLSDLIEQNNLSVKYLINTHCHIDHILGLNFVKKNFDPVFLAPSEDLELLKSAEVQGAAFGMMMNTPPIPDEFIKEDKQILLGKINGKFLFTPGHTPGEFCLYFEKEKICITGDVLFKESIGRTDLWGGNYNTLINSINTKLMILPDDVEIYPGHGEKSSIGFERKNNPFLQTP